MELNSKIKKILYEYDKVITSSSHTEIKKALLILDIKSIFSNSDYNITKELEEMLNSILESLQDKIK